MPCYRCYFLDSEEHIVGYEVLDLCANDSEALEAANSLLHQRLQYRGVSVWDRARKVFEKMIASICLTGLSSLADTLDAIEAFEGAGVLLVS